MATLTESAIFEEGIFQLEKSTPPLGGAPMFSGSSPTQGHANAQAAQLANRTQWLKSKVDTDLTEITSYANLRAYTGPATSPNLYDGARSGRFRKVATDPTGYTDDDAVTIIGSNGWVWQRINPTPVMPGWFGVVGDGATNPARNDQLAFNALWRYIEKTDGGLVHIPDGLYLCGGVAGDVFARAMILPKTSINGHTKVVCSPNAIFRRRGPYTLMAWTQNNDLYQEYGSNGRNFIWDGGVMDANVAAVGVNNLIGLIGCENITMQNITFYDGTGSHCIDLNSSRHIKIKDCVFYSEPSNNGILAKEAIQLAEQRQTTANGGTLGLEDVDIDNCQFLPRPGQDIGWQIGVGNHYATATIYQKNIRVRNCYFKNCSEVGVKILKHSDSIVENNTFENCFYGVGSITAASSGSISWDQDGNVTGKSETAYNVKVLNNTFVNCANTPIILQSPGYTTGMGLAFNDKWLISGNTIGTVGSVIQTGAAGICAYWMSNSVIENNSIFNQRRGLDLQYAQNSQIKGNEISTTLANGIIVRETIDTDFANMGYTTNLDIYSNQIYSVGTDAISVAGGRSVAVYNNTIRDTLAADGTRSAIIYSGTSVDGLVHDNAVKSGLTSNRFKNVVEILSTTSRCTVKDNFGSAYVSTSYPSIVASTTGYMEETGMVAPEGVIAAPLYSRYYNRSTGTSYKKTGGAAGNTGWVVG